MALRKHMTQAEMSRINKLLRSGVTDIGEIQSEVFIHSACIQNVIDVYNKQNPVKKSRKKAAPAVDPLT